MAKAATPTIRSWQASSALKSTERFAAGRHRYDRARDLPRLVPLWPNEINDCSPAGRARLIQVLQRALRRERQRGLDGHWSYDLARHRALLAACRAEQSSDGGRV